MRAALVVGCPHTCWQWHVRRWQLPDSSRHRHPVRDRRSTCLRSRQHNRPWHMLQNTVVLAWTVWLIHGQRALVIAGCRCRSTLPRR